MTSSDKTVLSVDIETFSDVSLKDVGVYKYVDAPSFKVLLLAYAYDDGPVKILDLENGDIWPEKLRRDLLDPDIVKTAFNAQFERLCLDKTLKGKTGPWDCTMIRAWSVGISGGLDLVGRRLGIEEDKQKLYIGKNLIRLFSVPRKPSKANGNKKVYTAEDKPEEWEQFKNYCVQDVEAERAVREKLIKYPVMEVEKRLYKLDQDINDRGIRIDLEMAESAININNDLTAKQTNRFKELTGIESPNQVEALKGWIKDRTGITVPSITKGTLPELRETFKDDPEILEALDIREVSGRTSVSKYEKMIATAGPDGRSRGNTQFFGAHTGRWAGRLIQLQNLPRNHLEDIETARDLVAMGDAEILEMIYDDPGDILRQCVRPTIIPADGKKFIVADFSAIEARVLAWLAGEEWRMEVFRSHGKIYEASASKMFGVPIEEIDKGSPLRQKGKVSELALGYAGSVGALKTMGALEMGLEEAELKPLVDQWRTANPKIKKFWYNVENACKKAIQETGVHHINDKVSARRLGEFLFIELPSGRRIGYAKACLKDHSKFEGKDQIWFEDVVAGKVKMIDTYYGKLTENIVQAVARDCLAHAMLALDRAGYEIVFHVHDEVIIEIEKEREELEAVCAIMGAPVSWAPGLPLPVDGYECNFYMKD